MSDHSSRHGEDSSNSVPKTLGERLAARFMLGQIAFLAAVQAISTFVTLA